MADIRGREVNEFSERRTGSRFGNEAYDSNPYSGGVFPSHPAPLGETPIDVPGNGGGDGVVKRSK